MAVMLAAVAFLVYVGACWLTSRFKGDPRGYFMEKELNDLKLLWAVRTGAMALLACALIAIGVTSGSIKICLTFLVILSVLVFKDFKRTIYLFELPQRRT